MIKNIVFDMGEVLVHFSSHRIVEHLDITEEDKELIIQNVFKSKYWALTDFCISHKEAFEYMKGNLPERLHKIALDCAINWYRPEYLMPRMLDIVKELKDLGYHLYLLSNAGTNQELYWSQMPYKQYFDGKLISAEEKTWKPCPEIFQKFFKKFDLAPEECLFIDDLKENIASGLLLGMDGIVFKNPEDLRIELNKFGVKIKHD